MDNIDDIASDTNYNGKKLLDGSMRAYIAGDGETTVSEFSSSQNSKKLVEASVTTSSSTEVLSNVTTDLGTTFTPAYGSTQALTIVYSNVGSTSDWQEISNPIGSTTVTLVSEDSDFTEGTHTTVSNVISTYTTTEQTGSTSTATSNVETTHDTWQTDDYTLWESSTKAYTLTETAASTTVMITASGTEYTETWQIEKNKVEDVTKIHSEFEIKNVSILDYATSLSGNQNITIDDNAVNGNTAGVVFKLASNFSGTINITTSQAVTLVGSGATNSNVHINMSGNASELYLKNVNINNTTAASTISCNTAKTNNVIHLIGTNNIIDTGHGAAAVVNAGGGLTMRGINGGSLNITANGGAGAIIGSNGAANRNADGGTCGNITIDCGTNININATGTQNGAGIGAGQHGSCGYININGCAASDGASANVTVKFNSGSNGANIGSGFVQITRQSSTCSGIKIDSNAKVTASRVDRQAACIGAGYTAATVTTNVYLDAILSLSNSNNTAYKGITYVNTQQYNGSVDNSTDPSLQMLSINGYRVYTDTYRQNVKETYNYVHKSKTEDVTKNTYNYKATNVYKMFEAATTATTTITGRAPYHALAIQSGDKAGQIVRLHLEDMHTNTMGLTGISVSTREAATNALTALDDAINYALDQATSVGAIINRLEYTEVNLVTASENTQASESVIRDADMAKAMMDYARNNVLQQASQTMLAQANQNVGSVLNLLN